jgi:hypothetical protein
MSPLVALFDQLCDALECLLLGAEPTFVGANLGSTVRLFMAAVDRRDRGVANNTECRKLCADGVCDVTRGQMGVVFFRHPRVGVPELCGKTPKPTPFIAKWLA